MAGLVFNAFFRRACYGFCCCCFTGRGSAKGLKTFSNNIYHELSAEDLKREYDKTKSELEIDSKIALERAQGSTKKYYELLNDKLKAKLIAIDEAVIERLKQNGIKSELGHPIESFVQLFKLSKTHSSHRLRSLYSYDIKDNPDFKKVQNIEESLRQLVAVK
jgi:hypothetical protein